MLRARRTAQAISDRTGLLPHLHPELAEMNFGEAEGLTIEQLQEHYVYDHAAISGPDRSRCRHFQEGESRRNFHDRVRITVDSIATAHQGERIVVVAHGGVISSVVAQMLGEDPTDWRKYHVDNCSVTHVELATTGPIAHLFNDVVHLEELNVDHRWETDRRCS